MIVHLLQLTYPKAAIVYASATLGIAPEDWSYLSRIGLWGARAPFPNFATMCKQLAGVAELEMVPHFLRSTGAFFSRQLSFQGVEFKIMNIVLTDTEKYTYNSCAELVIFINLLILFTIIYNFFLL